MQNPLAKLSELFRSAVSARSAGASVVGIDISSSSIKAVQLKKEKGKAVLETYGQIFLGPYAGLGTGQIATLGTEQFIQAMGDLIKGAQITATTAIISVPLRSSLILLVELPAASEKEINDMIPIEARKYIPVPISEVTLDWWVIPKKDSPMTDDNVTNSGEVEFKPVVPGQNSAPVAKKIEVLMVAIHNSAITEFQQITSGVNLTPQAYEIETFSAIRSTFGRDMMPTMILDMGASATKITIVDYGIVRLSHIIPKGAQDITVAIQHSSGVDFMEAEKIKRESGILGQTGKQNISSVASPVIEYIFFEANKVVANYQRKYRRAISKTVLIGGGSQLRGIMDIAARSFEVEVQMGDPFSKVDSPAFLEGVLKQAGPEFAVAVGAALRGLQD